MVVTLSAKELSIGITKLSGSKPPLKARIEIVYEIMTMIGIAMTFVISRMYVKLMRNEASNTPFNSNDRNDREIKIIIEANHELNICLLILPIAIRDGLRKPSANLVVTTEPTTEPTSPIVSIKAG